MSHIDGFLIEVNQYPRYGDNLDLFTIKDYFYYNSDQQEYGHRSTIVPVETLINKEDLPEESIIRAHINSKTPIMRRVIDLNKQKESWIFEANILEELRND